MTQQLMSKSKLGSSGLEVEQPLHCHLIHTFDGPRFKTPCWLSCCSSKLKSLSIKIIIFLTLLVSIVSEEFTVCDYGCGLHTLNTK